MTEIINAINQHLYIEFIYKGLSRKVIPYAYGNHVTTHDKVMRGLQVAGSSSSGKYGDAKLWTVSEIVGIRILDEEFAIPPSYQKGDKHISPIEAEL